MQLKSGLTLLLVIGGLAACPSSAGSGERPGIPAQHVMLVTIAGMRADHTSAWQYERPTTWSEIDGGLRRRGRALAIDDLAAEGVMFANAFAPSGDATVSLGSLFTGRSPLDSGVLESTAAPSGPTLATCFAEAGFATCGFVAGGACSDPGWRTGFDVFETGATDREVLGRALDWVNGHDYGNGQGVFLWIHLAGPTFPFEPTLEQSTFDRGGPKDFARMYVDPDYAGDADGSEAYRASAVEPTPEDCDHIVALYDGEIAQTNHLLELFLDFYLYAGASSEVWQRTLFVLAGTGGVELFEHGPSERSWGTAGPLTDPVLRVPLLVRHPDSLTGRRIFAQVVELADVMPTLLEWFRLPPREVEGRSLLPLLDEEGVGFEPRSVIAFRPIGGEGGPDGLSIRDARFRLGASRALYDQVADPLALDDVSAEHPDEAERLWSELRDAALRWTEADTARRRAGSDARSAGE